MAPADDLAGLLEQLEGARTPLERLRRVALAWREVRRLDRSERETLATRLGMDGVGALLERLAVRRGGLAPAELLRAVHAAQQADPRELQRILHGLADPATRRDTVVQGLEQMEQRLARAAETSGHEAPSGDEEEDALAPAAAAAAETVAAPEPAPRVVPPPLPAPADEQASPAVSEETEPPAPPAVVVAPAEPVEAPSAAPEPPRPQAGSLPSSEGEGVPLAVTDLAADLAGTSGLVGRLARLRRALAGDGLPADQALTAVLESFPDGWARRRAFEALLAAGLPQQAGIVGELLALLGAERDRAWCLVGIARAGGLPSDEASRLAHDLSSPTLRRRVRRLAGG